MAKTRIHKSPCAVCCKNPNHLHPPQEEVKVGGRIRMRTIPFLPGEEPKGERVPCGYCTEQTGTKQGHTLCDKCFLNGCPAKAIVDKILN